MASQDLLRSFVADAAIVAFSLVKLGSDAKHVVTAAGPTDNVIGIYSNPVDCAANDRVDITLSGIDRCRAGAAFTFGVPLTSDASGRVVAAAPAAGVNNRLIGMAFQDSTAAGDQVEVLISQGAMQG
jgi:hypothetical protein